MPQSPISLLDKVWSGFHFPAAAQKSLDVSADGFTAMDASPSSLGRVQTDGRQTQCVTLQHVDNLVTRERP